MSDEHPPTIRSKPNKPVILSQIFHITAPKISGIMFHGLCLLLLILKVFAVQLTARVHLQICFVVSSRNLEYPPTCSLIIHNHGVVDGVHELDTPYKKYSTMVNQLMAKIQYIISNI